MKCSVRVSDPHFHQLHHALGSPWPDEIMGDTYRNHFAIDSDSDLARRMRAHKHWTGGSVRFGMAYFHVTQEGKRALLDHMRANVEVPARYCVTFTHHEGATIVPAKSRSAAKYAAYLNADTDWPFTVFVSKIKSVRIHSRANVPAQS